MTLNEAREIVRLHGYYNGDRPKNALYSVKWPLNANDGWSLFSGDPESLAMRVMHAVNESQRWRGGEERESGERRDFHKRVRTKDRGTQR